MKIQGFFSGIKNANKAVEVLKKKGFKNSVVDLNSHYVSNMHHSPRVAGNKNGVNLSTIVLDTENYSADETTSAIKAANPMVSGMGSFQELADINYRVIVDAADEDIEQVKYIIKNLGGDLKNYNVNVIDSVK